jgi:enolase
LSKITSISGRILYDSRGSKTIEVDIESDKHFVGRVCAPSGASVGKYEAIGFPNGKPEESLKILKENSGKFLNLDPSDLKSVHDILRTIDETENYSKIGGALAFAVTIAAMESASKAAGEPLFKILSNETEFRFPFPLGNTWNSRHSRNSDMCYRFQDNKRCY